MLNQTFYLKETQKVPINIHEAWAFFSNPLNLKEITPPHLNLVVTNEMPEKMHAGMIITYVVEPLLKIKMNWVTEITNMQEPFFFVDEQRFGPYKFWHHQHIFKEIDGGVEVTDIVHYKIRGGIFSSLINKLIVKNELQKIFSYRTEVLLKKFGSFN
ncbi:MAG: hypothetical protein CMH79_02360 [Nitrospinae bacterium]|nr:hypothetical protein [Nitrospinota bacterium]|tara:strand:+ start:2924 stop:3394 length:471 start_codon:yes stop_codon:yes gene_type:complete